MVKAVPRITIPRPATSSLSQSKHEVRLTNLQKPFWPERGITKGMLIQHYADVAPVLLPHIRDRAMVMKRYPHGCGGRVLLHEARAGAAARLDSHVH